MTRRKVGRTRLGMSLGKRIFGAMALVVVAGAGTLLAVSLLLAPTLFHQHLVEADVAQDPGVSQHIEQGFVTAISVALLVGVGAAIAVAAGLALLVARRVSAPISATASTAAQLAAGDYSARVADPHMGPELDGLAESVNTLAARLETAESVRSRLLAEFVHELRTPLASIEATVEAIVDGVLPADAETLGALTDQSRRLARMTDDLAALSRAEEHSFRLHLQSIDLVATAQRAASAAAARFAQAEVALYPPVGAPVLVVADPDRVSEVIGQLLDNAIGHTSPGDSVTMLAAARDGLGQLDIRDTGCGFDPQEADRIFQRFYRAPERGRTHREGTGIGLTIARTLIEAQGGTVTASSQGIASGATFTMTLPCQQRRGRTGDKPVDLDGSVT